MINMAGWRKLVCALGIVLGATGMPSPQAAAQTSKELTERYDSWQVKCVSGSDNAWSRCSMFQELVQKDSGKRILQISFAKKQPEAMAILTPFGLLLQKGVALEVDGTAIGHAEFVTCRPFGCIARHVLDDPALARLRAGAELKLIGAAEDDSPFVMTAPLAGFTAAHGRLVELGGE